MDKKENQSILELKEKLNSPWIFQGLDKERRNVEVEKKLILDANLDFINVVTDLYTVEALHKDVSKHLEEKSANRIIRETSNYYGDLLRLKFFYEDELSNILERLKDVKEEELEFVKYIVPSRYFYYYYMGDLEELLKLYKEIKIKESSFFIE